MKTTPEALKALYQTLGGSSVNVAGESKTTGILNKIAALFGSTATAEKIPDAIGNINAVASGITKPAGKKSITTTAETNVADYATAQVSDENLVAGNIKKDVAILGVTGSYEGGGSSDFSTATVTVNLSGTTEYVLPLNNCLTLNGRIETFEMINESDNSEYTVVLYQDRPVFLDNEDELVVAVSGNIVATDGGYNITGDCSITAKQYVLL